MRTTRTAFAAGSVVEVPDHVRAGIARYLNAAGLAFGAFDFVVRPDGAVG